METKQKVYDLSINIQEQYSEYQAFMKNKPFDDFAQYIVIYTNTMMVYGEEIGFLYNNGWNNSIEPLTRDFLECYAITKKLIELYNTTDFEEYIRYLYYKDMKQTMSVNKGIGKNIKHILDINLNTIKEILENYFQELKSHIKKDDLQDSIKKIIWKLDNNYEKGNRKKFNITITKAVGEAILNNKELTKAHKGKYKGAMALYAALCNSSHSNISSICKRSRKGEQIVMNAENKNASACVELIYYCMMDINNLIKRII